MGRPNAAQEELDLVESQIIHIAPPRFNRGTISRWSRYRQKKKSQYDAGIEPYDGGTG
jgi:hypothetical protein